LRNRINRNDQQVNDGIHKPVSLADEKMPDAEIKINVRDYIGYRDKKMKHD
jgi:hypothetical protein